MQIRTRTFAGLFALCATTCLSVAAHAAPRYAFEAIDSPDGLFPGSVYAFNNAGQVLGGFYTPSGDREVPRLYTPGVGYTDPTPPGASDVGAYGLNEAGQVVGRANGRAWQFGAGGGGPVPGVSGDGSSAAAINDAGVVVGSHDVGGLPQAFVAVPGQAVRTVGSPYGGYAMDVNNRGEALLGWVGGPIGPLFRYDIASGALTQVGLDQEAGATVGRLNDRGEIAGQFGWKYDVHIHVYGPDGEHTRVPGLAGFSDESLYDMNNRGQVLGAAVNGGPGIPFESRLFLYTPGEGSVALGPLLGDVPADWGYLNFGYLNDRGDILGAGQHGSDWQLFMFRALAAPVPEPGALVLLVAGLAGVGAAVRRPRGAQPSAAAA